MKKRLGESWGEGGGRPRILVSIVIKISEIENRVENAYDKIDDFFFFENKINRWTDRYGMLVEQ